MRFVQQKRLSSNAPNEVETIRNGWYKSGKLLIPSHNFDDAFMRARSDFELRHMGF